MCFSAKNPGDPAMQARAAWYRENFPNSKAGKSFGGSAFMGALMAKQRGITFGPNGASSAAVQPRKPGGG